MLLPYDESPLEAKNSCISRNWVKVVGVYIGFALWLMNIDSRSTMKKDKKYHILTEKSTVTQCWVNP